MNKSARLITKYNMVFSHLLWVLVMLFGVFNIICAWVLWHLTGFAALFCIAVTFVMNLISLICSLMTKEREYIIKNGMILAISGISVLLMVLVFAEWNVFHLF